MKPRGVWILQGSIPHYRVGLFNALAKAGDVTIVHGDPRFDPSRCGASFCHKYNPYIQMGCFRWSPRLIWEAWRRRPSFMVIMCDLHWISYIACGIVLPIFSRGSIRVIWWGPWRTKSRIANSLRAILVRIGHKTVLYAQSHLDYFLSRGTPLSKLRVINNSLLVKPRVKSYLSNNKNTILCVGTLNDRKKIDKLLMIFKESIISKNREVSLTIIGNGPRKNFLVNLVEDLKINDRVNFVGEITNDVDLSEFYKNAICCVSLGQAGLSILQSFANGVPFVTEKSAISGGEVENIVNGYNGFLLDNSLVELPAVLDRMIDDADLRVRLGKNAYNYYSEKCTVESMVNSFNEIWMTQ